MLKSRKPGRPILAIGLLLFVALATGLAGYATAGGDSADSGISHPPATGMRGVVQSASGDRLTVTTPDGSVDLKLQRDAVFESLKPATPASLRTGDWLNLGAVDNQLTLYALIGLVAIPQDRLQRR